MTKSIMAAIAVPLASLAACSGTTTPTGNQSAIVESGASRALHSGAGTVEKIDGAEVTIAHGPIESLGWPAMTMAFASDARVLPEDLKVGDRVSFGFVQAGGTSKLTSLSKQ